jgi:hypothetical protein
MFIRSMSNPRQMTLIDRRYDRYPDAQPWVIRIGHRAVFRFGSRKQ